MKMPFIFLLLLTSMFPGLGQAADSTATSFVVQLTRGGENYGHRRALLQIDKVMDDLGENNLAFEVVAYE